MRGGVNVSPREKEIGVCLVSKVREVVGSGPFSCRDRLRSCTQQYVDKLGFWVLGWGLPI